MPADASASPTPILPPPVVPPPHQTRPTTGQVLDVTLGAYINDNGTLLQVLGVFVALTVFSAALTRQPGFNLLLTGLLFVCTILIGLEARARLPRFRDRSGRLTCFALSFEGALALLGGYGIVWYHPLYRAGTDAVVTFTIWAIAFTVAVSKVRATKRLLSFFYFPPQRYTALQQRIITLTGVVASILLFVVIYRLVQPIVPTINMWLDSLGRLLGAKE